MLLESIAQSACKTAYSTCAEALPNYSGKLAQSLRNRCSNSPVLTLNFNGVRTLVDKHIPRLKNRLNAATIDKPLDLLVLVVYGDGFIDNVNYSSELGQLIRTISKGLLDLATAPYDHTEGDVDHIYYTCKKILYYSRLFSRNNNVTSLRDISLALDQLKESIHAFETKYPLMKE